MPRESRSIGPSRTREFIRDMWIEIKNYLISIRNTVKTHEKCKGHTDPNDAAFSKELCIDTDPIFS